MWNWILSKGYRAVQQKPTCPRKCFLLTELLLQSLMRKLIPCSAWLTGKTIISPHFTWPLVDFRRRVFFLQMIPSVLNIPTFTKKSRTKGKEKGTTHKGLLTTHPKRSQQGPYVCFKLQQFLKSLAKRTLQQLS